MHVQPSLPLWRHNHVRGTPTRKRGARPRGKLSRQEASVFTLRPLVERRRTRGKHAFVSRISPSPAALSRPMIPLFPPSTSIYTSTRTIHRFDPPFDPFSIQLSQRENFNNSRIWYYVASFAIPNFPNRRKSSKECLYTQGLRVTRSVDTILLPFHEDNNVSLDVYVLLDADRSKKDRRVPVVKFSNMLANFGSNESILGYLASKGRCSKRYPISDVWDLRRKDERPATE